MTAKKYFTEEECKPKQRQVLRNCVLPELGKYVFENILGVKIVNNLKD